MTILETLGRVGTIGGKIVEEAFSHRRGTSTIVFVKDQDGKWKFGQAKINGNGYRQTSPVIYEEEKAAEECSTNNASDRNGHSSKTYLSTK